LIRHPGISNTCEPRVEKDGGIDTSMSGGIVGW